MVLGTLVEAHGFHPAAWLTDEAEPDSPTNVAWHQRIAQLAEASLLDFFFVADTPATRTDNLTTWSRAPMYMNCLEPVTLLTAIAGVTKHIGLGATASTSFYEPYNLARLFASLDHISNGRAAWNVVTSANDYAARNFGLDRLPPHARRYDKAHEFLKLVKALWDTWEDDAFINDKERCLTFDPDKFHVVDHKGEFFTLYGGLNMARPPQGYPVIIQAGASDTGKEFAAETSEVIFGTGADIGQAKAFYKDLKGRMGKFGRQPRPAQGARRGDGGCRREQGRGGTPARWLAGPSPYRCRPDAPAQRPRDRPLRPAARRARPDRAHPGDVELPQDLLRRDRRHDPRRLDAARDLPPLQPRQGDVLRQPVEIADMMQTWVEEGACDGFMMTFPVLPSTMVDFCDKVVPELQRRGLFRTEYAGTTFRENLGLDRPQNAHVAAAHATAPLARTA